MGRDDEMPRWAADMLRRQCGVLSSGSANAWLGNPVVRWRLESGRWQRPCRGVLVTHSGPLTRDQRLWVAALGAGPGAMLAGLTAARLDGLTGFDEPVFRIVVPANRGVRPLDGVIVHRCALGPDDIHPVRAPARTRLARSLLDAAAWAPASSTARAILAAGVQQRLVLPDQLAAALSGRPRIRRRSLMVATLDDIRGGAQALSELDFSKLLRRHRLPQPNRQVMRPDERGHRRWLDSYWDQARLIAEIDGMWHMEALSWWADMRRDNELTVRGYRVLRFPAFAVRDDAAAVAAQLKSALAAA